MRYLKTYKIFEADGPAEPLSKWSWAKELTIPKDIQMDIYDMSFELKDEGYNVSFQWWPPFEQGKFSDRNNKLYKDNKYPSINITKKDPNDEFAWEKISYAWIKDFCERVSSYLDDKGYNVVFKYRKVNTNDYYDINKSYPNQEPFSDHHMATSIHFRIDMIDRNIYGDVNESVHDTKDEIEEVVSTCKDIMLEAQDIFGNSDVEKEYKDDKVIITCLYKMLDIKRRIEEFKPTVDDVHQRLIEYMTSKGFSFKNRGESSIKYIDIISYNITYNITFTKELDKEFIGHLRYLKKYNLLKESTKDDLRDILLELEDMDYKVTHNDDIRSYREPGGIKAIWVKEPISEEFKNLPWDELKEYALRIKSYLGNRYLSFMWRDIPYNQVALEKPYKTVELNEDTEIDDRVWSFAIKYKE